MRISQEFLDEYAGLPYLPRFTLLGGYTLVYYTERGDTLCGDCAKRSLRTEDPAVEVETYDEGPMMHCDDCQDEIHSSYGDPSEVDE